MGIPTPPAHRVSVVDWVLLTVHAGFAWMTGDHLFWLVFFTWFIVARRATHPVPSAIFALVFFAGGIAVVVRHATLPPPALTTTVLYMVSSIRLMFRAADYMRDMRDKWRAYADLSFH